MHTHTNQLLPPQPSGAVPPDAEALNRPGQTDTPDLTADQVLTWADAFFTSHGDWPRWDSGPVPESHGETWFRISAAMVLGQRGFRRGESLGEFFARHGRVRCVASERELSVGLIMTWARAWRKRTGRWPSVRSGQIPGQDGLTWRTVNEVLRSGRAGRPAGTNLSLLRRVGPESAEALPLTVQEILEWADDHHKQTGKWPASTSGRVRTHQVSHG